MECIGCPYSGEGSCWAPCEEACPCLFDYFLSVQLERESYEDFLFCESRNFAEDLGLSPPISSFDTAEIAS